MCVFSCMLSVGEKAKCVCFHSCVCVSGEKMCDCFLEYVCACVSACMGGFLCDREEECVCCSVCVVVCVL